MKNKIIREEVDFGGQNLTLETGFLARQASGSVLARLGETTVLATVVIGSQTGSDYFPLQVVYEERLYASGKIKGSRFIKREGKPSDEAVLTGRMIDRSLRSLFDSNIRNEIQVVITVLSLDRVNPPDTLAVLAASSAMSLCNIDGFGGPISSIRIGRQGQKFLPNPSYAQIENSDLDLIVSGDGENVMMVECGSKIVPENIIADGIEKSSNILAQLNEFQKVFIESVKSSKSFDIVNVSPNNKAVSFWDQYKSVFEEFIYNNENDKSDINDFILQSGESVGLGVELIKSIYNGGQFDDIDSLSEWFESQEGDVINFDELEGISLEKKLAISILELQKELDDLDDVYDQIKRGQKEFIERLVKQNILENSRRIDGRAMDQVRELECQVGLLGRTHGSSIFQRGETQVLNVLTVGTKNDGQILDNMENFEEVTKRYIHHYNFPPYSVGETGRYGGPGRREIGHGNLAEKAMLPVLPDFNEFPYTIRLVSECLGSNGSTSMASTCASSLSLMDGGIPISSHVAGIAMGVVVDPNDSSNFKILTDIAGMEDHFGGMDFKIAGTRDGVTAIQLDNKLRGVTAEVLKQAIKQSKSAREMILDKMESIISSPRESMSQYAPSVQSINIPLDKVSEVIGPSGKVIKSIIAKTGCEIEIDDANGQALIYGEDSEKSLEALDMIKNIIKEYKAGDIVDVIIFRLENYGAFAKIDGGEKEGLIHISETGTGKGTKIEDIFVLGQKLKAKIKGLNEKGQISLTIDS